MEGIAQLPDSVFYFILVPLSFSVAPSDPHPKPRNITPNGLLSPFNQSSSNQPSNLSFLCRPSQARGIQPAPLCHPTPHIHLDHMRRPMLSSLGKASFCELSSPLRMNRRTTGCYARLYFFGAALPSLETPTDILCVRHFNPHSNPGRLVWLFSNYR